MQEKTAVYYSQKVELVRQYIHAHLADDLSVKTLAGLAGISFFHFHRIMKAALNEPLASYISRTRLDTAVNLIRYSDTSFREISVNVGFQDLSSFSKAFSKEFGLSPMEFKKQKGTVINTQVDYRVQANNLVSDIHPKYITLPDKVVASIEVFGEYGGPKAYEAWDELEKYVRKYHLTGWNPEVFSVYYDDPETTGTELCRSRVCITVKKQAEPSGNICFQKVRGGKYAVFRYKGPYEYLWDLYDSIYGNFVLVSGLELGDLPCMEKYLNYAHNTKPDDLLTEIYIPIKS